MMPLWLGWFFLFSGVAVIGLMPLSVKLSKIVPAKYLIALGFSLATIGMFASSHITPQTDYNTLLKCEYCR
jgi:hypothetical protein